MKLKRTKKRKTKKDYDATYRKRHPEIEAARKRRWVEKNREHHNNYQAERYKNFTSEQRDHKNAVARKWYKRNAEKCRQYQRDYRAKKKTVTGNL